MCVVTINWTTEPELRDLSIEEEFATNGDQSLRPNCLVKFYLLEFGRNHSEEQW
jgi:hypothetical protein